MARREGDLPARTAGSKKGSASPNDPRVKLQPWLKLMKISDAWEQFPRVPGRKVGGRWSELGRHGRGGNGGRVCVLVGGGGGVVWTSCELSGIEVWGGSLLE